MIQPTHLLTLSDYPISCLPSVGLAQSLIRYRYIRLMIHSLYGEYLFKMAQKSDRGVLIQNLSVCIHQLDGAWRVFVVGCNCQVRHPRCVVYDQHMW